MDDRSMLLDLRSGEDRGDDSLLWVATENEEVTIGFGFMHAHLEPETLNAMRFVPGENGRLTYWEPGDADFEALAARADAMDWLAFLDAVRDERVVTVRWFSGGGEGAWEWLTADATPSPSDADRPSHAQLRSWRGTLDRDVVFG